MTILLYELDRRRLAEVAPEALVVLPVGATEQHGPHLPVGTDFLVVERVARAAAERASAEIPVFVAPTLPFGSSHHHLPFGGTLSLQTETFFHAACDLVNSLVDSGFRRVFCLNGHGGNSELLQLVARDAALARDATIGTAEYWMVAWDALVEAGAADKGWLPGHAGFFETSLILASRPDLVASDRPDRPGEDWDDQTRRTPYRRESHDSWLAIDGYTDSPATGDATEGARYFDVVVDAVARALVSFYRSAS